MLMLWQTVFSAGQHPTPLVDTHIRNAGSKVQFVEQGALPVSGGSGDSICLMVCNWHCVIYVNGMPEHKGSGLELP